jgi:hypothetical protein
METIVKAKVQISERKIAIVEVTRDFDDPYMKLTWPLGTELEVPMDDFIKGGPIARYTAGHGIHLALMASHVKGIRGSIIRVIEETEIFEL